MPDTAFLVLDMQNDLIDPAGKIARHGFHKVVAERQLIPKIRRVLDAVRAKGQLAAFVRVGFRPDYADAISQSARLAKLKQEGGCQMGTWGTEFPADLAPQGAEVVFTKRAVNSFHDTGLLTYLRLHGVKTVVLAGVYTHMVVDSTARFADDSGFVVKVLEDCCGSPDPELHRVEVEKILPLYGTVMSSQDFLAAL